MQQRTAEFIKMVQEVGSWCFDCEHEKDLLWSQPNLELTGVGFATENMVFFERDLEEAKTIIQALFPYDELEAVAYNAKYDLKCLVAVGWITSKDYPKGICDPMVAVNLLDENRRPGDMGLKKMIWDQFGHQMMKFDEADAFGQNSPEFTKYAEADAYWEYKLHQDLKPRLKDEELWKVFRKILMPAVLVFADVEIVGVGWDIDGARELLRGFQVFRREIEAEIKSEIGELNLQSGDQLARRLFEELGYSTRGIEMTDSGKRLKTDATAMAKLSRKYPVCEKISKWRTSNKMISTYVEPLTRMALEDPNERIHPTFWLVSTTGRTRCEKPNFQNIPAWLDKSFNHLNIRKNIVPKPGWTMIVADLSQIELRICGHVSQDPEFLRAYQEWNCTSCGTKGSDNTILHKCPKCGLPEDDVILKNPKAIGFWHGLDLHQMTTDDIPALGGDRQNGKKANFEFIYYATPGRMAYDYPTLSLKQWVDVHHQYFVKYCGVKRWHLLMEQEMYRSGICRDIFGRKRRITKRDIVTSAKRALNMFINFPVQASACELIELSMAKLREKWLESGDWMTNIIQSNFVHDELVFECPEDQEDRFIPDIREVMENTVQLRVPIRTDIVTANSWGACK